MEHIIRREIESRLSAIGPPLPTAWENVQFDPPAPPYQRGFLLPAGNVPHSFGAGAKMRYAGVYQVSLYYPLGEGSGDAMARAKQIIDAFPVGTLTVADGLHITITSRPEIAQGIPTDTAWLLPISINYIAYEV